MIEGLAVCLFWGALSVTAYTYFGYPLVLAILYRNRLEAEPRSIWPPLTVLVAAYNEERYIARKVQNLLDREYPGELDVIVVSDGSTDRTAAIVRRFEGPQVQLLAQPDRRGKNAALNRGVSAARREIIVFTDANALLAPGALRRLVAPFCNSQVGLVSGQGSYGELGDGTTRVVSNAYVRYEAFLKQRESSFGFLPGVDGALYAMRRFPSIRSSRSLMCTICSIRSRLLWQGCARCLHRKLTPWSRLPMTRGVNTSVTSVSALKDISCSSTRSPRCSYADTSRSVGSCCLTGCYAGPARFFC